MHNIPYLDIRDSSPVELARRYPEKAVRLIEVSRDTYGIASRLASHIALPVGDYLAKRWLERTRNPYRDEIRAYADIVRVQGVYALNLACEWTCTSGVYRKENGVALSRILDWPFPELGEHIVVAHQKSEAGEFYNVTWPAVSGVFNAMAPGRFAVTLNMAPMRRYRLDLASDWVRNRLRFYRENGLPPAHLLRKACETATSYDEAKRILATELISSPVIYVLSGVREGEGCVIERVETDYVIRELGGNDAVCAANHFESRFNGLGHGWTPRPIDSHGRAKHAASLPHHRIDENLGWFESPSANSMSRLVLHADAANGTLSVMGTYGATPVTSIFRI